jgi:integrase
MAGYRRVFAGQEAITITGALEQYGAYLRDEKGNKERTVENTLQRLGVFFPPSARLTDLKRTTCEKLYQDFREEKVKDAEGKPTAELRYSPDSHRNVLAEAKTFLRWCIAKRWLRSSPLDHVQGVGKRRKRAQAAQLRIDEMRKWTCAALEKANAGQDEAVAAMMTLYMGMRASEITERVVRDVDNDGTVVVIDAGKTDASRREVDIPSFLQPYIARLVRSRPGHAPLFASERAEKKDEKTPGHHWRDWPRRAVQRICKAAGVPKTFAHAMRASFMSWRLQGGAELLALAAQVGHASPSTTTGTYAHPNAVHAARQRQILKVIAGGKAAG